MQRTLTPVACSRGASQATQCAKTKATTATNIALRSASEVTAPPDDEMGRVRPAARRDEDTSKQMGKRAGTEETQNASEDASPNSFRAPFLAEKAEILAFGVKRLLCGAGFF